MQCPECQCRQIHKQIHIFLPIHSLTSCPCCLFQQVFTESISTKVHLRAKPPSLKGQEPPAELELSVKGMNNVSTSTAPAPPCLQLLSAEGAGKKPKKLSRGSLFPGQTLIFIRTSWMESRLAYTDKNPVLLLQAAEGFQTHPGVSLCSRGLLGTWINSSWSPGLG